MVVSIDATSLRNHSWKLRAPMHSFCASFYEERNLMTAFINYKHRLVDWGKYPCGLVAAALHPPQNTQTNVQTKHRYLNNNSNKDSISVTSMRLTGCSHSNTIPTGNI
jgi:hypothetical protein